MTPAGVTTPGDAPSGGLFGTPWPAVVLGILAAVALGLLVPAVRRRSRRGRRRWPLAVPGGVGVLLLALLSAAAGVNAYVGYAPTLAALGQLAGFTSLPTPSVTTPTRGRLVQLRIGDDALHVPTSTTWAFLPPGYDQHPEQRYPVVYLVHGYPGTSADWMRAGRIPELVDRLVPTGQLRPMIVVAPDVNGGAEHDTECLNAVDGPQVTAYLVQDVVHRVDTDLRTLPDRGHRALGGMSSGGYCALDVGLHHLGLFSVLLGFEPFGDPGRHAGDQELAGDPRLYREHSPSQYLPTMAFPHSVAVFLDEGDAQMTAVSRVRDLAAQLTARGQTVLYRTEVGQRHTWNEARVGAPYALQFAAQHFTGGAAAPPAARGSGTVPVAPAPSGPRTPPAPSSPAPSSPAPSSPAPSASPTSTGTPAR